MSFTHGRKAEDMLRELQRSDWLPPFNTSAMRHVIEEVTALHEEIVRIIEGLRAQGIEGHIGDASVSCSLVIQNASILRNKRCLLAYLHHRMNVIKNLRWETGNVIPEELKPLLDKREVSFFSDYDRCVSDYMQQVGVDLFSDMQPPKELKIEVRVLEDCGEIMTETGVINLTKNSTHFVRRADVQHLIKQNMLRHIESER